MVKGPTFQNQTLKRHSESSHYIKILFIWWVSSGTINICMTNALRILQSIIGLLNFSCRVVVPGWAFLRRLIALTKGLTRPFHHVRLNKEAISVIEAWLQFISEYNGCYVVTPWKIISSTKLHIHTDAAGSIGYAAVMDSEWFQGTWPEDWKSLSIACLELFAIFLSLEIWTQKLQNKCIISHTDNMSIVSIINSQTSSKHPAIIFLVRKMILTSLINNIIFKAVHIPGHSNGIADLLSRSQVNRAWTVDRNLRVYPIGIPHHLCPENIQLHRSWMQPLHQVPEQPTK